MKDLAHSHGSSISERTTILIPPVGGTSALTKLKATSGLSMRLTLTQLQKIGSFIHGLDSQGDTLLHSRLRYIFRLGFPREYETVRGAPVYVSLDDGLKVLFAIELLTFGLTNATITRSVRLGWDVIGRAIFVAWAQRAKAPDPQQVDSLIVTGNALYGPEDDERHQPLLFTPTSAKGTLLSNGQAFGHGSMLVIDLKTFVIRMAEAFPELLIATPRHIEAEMKLLSAEFFENDDEEVWQLEPVSTMPAPRETTT